MIRFHELEIERAKLDSGGTPEFNDALLAKMRELPLEELYSITKPGNIFTHYRIRNAARNELAKRGLPRCIPDFVIAEYADDERLAIYTGPQFHDMVTLRFVDPLPEGYLQHPQLHQSSIVRFIN